MKKLSLSGVTIKKGSGDIGDMGASLLLYAEPGIGKTHCVRYLPDGQTVYLGFEGGDEPLVGKDIFVINFQMAGGSDDLAAFGIVTKAISNGETIEINGQDIDMSKMTNVVIDNISELARFMQSGFMHSRGKSLMTLKEYGDTSVKMREYLRIYRDMKYHGKFVTFIAHEQEIEKTLPNGIVLTKKAPLIGKSIVNEVMGMVDMVGHLEFTDASEEQGATDMEPVRVIRIHPTAQVSAKCRILGFVDKYGPIVSQDIGDLYRNVYKHRKEIIKKEKESKK